MRLGKLFYYDGALIVLQSPCHPACNHFLTFIPSAHTIDLLYHPIHWYIQPLFSSIWKHFCHMRVYKKENTAAHRSRVIGTHPTIFHMIRVGSPYNPGPNLLSGKIIWSTWGHDQQWRSGIPTNVRLLGTWCGRGFLRDWKKTMAIIWTTMKRDVPNAPKENS